MVPHHSQAVEMGGLVADRTTRPELREFADRVVADQSGEVDRMNALLEEAGADSAMQGMDDGGMSGMMSDADMAELEGLAGDAFDLAFLRMMTAPPGRDRDGRDRAGRRGQPEALNAQLLRRTDLGPEAA